MRPSCSQHSSRIEALVIIRDEVGSLITAPTELGQVDNFFERLMVLASDIGDWASGEVGPGDAVPSSDLAEVDVFGCKIEKVDCGHDHDGKSKDDSLGCTGWLIKLFVYSNNDLSYSSKIMNL